MKTFFKDYKELCKMERKFYKDHWVGVIAVNVLITTSTLAVTALNNVMIDKINKGSIKGETKGES